MVALELGDAEEGKKLCLVHVLFLKLGLQKVYEYTMREEDPAKVAFAAVDVLLLLECLIPLHRALPMVPVK